MCLFLQLARSCVPVVSTMNKAGISGLKFHLLRKNSTEIRSHEHCHRFGRENKEKVKQCCSHHAARDGEDHGTEREMVRQVSQADDPNIS